MHASSEKGAVETELESGSKRSRLAGISNILLGLDVMQDTENVG